MELAPIETMEHAPIPWAAEAGAVLRAVVAFDARLVGHGAVGALAADALAQRVLGVDAEPGAVAVSRAVEARALAGRRLVLAPEAEVAERRRRRPPASAARPRSMPHLHQAVRTGTAEGLGACEQGAAAGEGRERRGGAADECAAGWCEAARPVRAASERTGCTRRAEYIVLDVQDATGVAATAGDRVLLAAAAALNELAPVIFG